MCPTAPPCVAIRYADGVVMAGDRRATAGNLISHRTIEKVFPADRYSGRRHRRRRRPGHGDGEALPAPARALREGRGRHAQPRGQGQPARPDGPRATCRPPCRASSSCRSSPATTPSAASGRLFDYDVTGGRYEERDYLATGSGSLHAGTDQGRLPRGHEPRRGRRPRDPGPVRGGRRGLRHRRTRPRARHLPGGRHHHRRAGFTSAVADDELAERFAAHRRSERRRSGGRRSHEHAVLRRRPSR